MLNTVQNGCQEAALVLTSCQWWMGGEKLRVVSDLGRASRARELSPHSVHCRIQCLYSLYPECSVVFVLLTNPSGENLFSGVS